MPQLTLYHSPSCPFCQRVFNYIQGAGIELEMKDVRSNPANRQELVSIGGKGQVPCLVIDGQALYESMDIIDWLRQNAN
jgi:glutaredoxin 3